MSPVWTRETGLAYATRTPNVSVVECAGDRAVTRTPQWPSRLVREANDQASAVERLITTAVTLGGDEHEERQQLRFAYEIATTMTAPNRDVTEELFKWARIEKRGANEQPVDLRDRAAVDEMVTERLAQYLGFLVGASR